MYFKSLELVGFKSFADKTKLNFEPGVTAIVGPNGCGKSNVSDSIRWVLGEQSAKSLRAGSMQDVIFNGTDNKEPINYAEVSLTFSNENRVLPIDYDEVTITRRIFRSGDTEYLLNKTPVRLKDIYELLMGTGIGTESYSIIEQGKMDLILSSRPEDRRFVFEEASGITKYKSKKKEALRKLEQTEQNLLRINDIILEVKRQISSIERQARKAEKYKVDFEKLKELEVKVSFAELKEIKTRERTYSVENEDAKTREKDLDLEVKSIASNIAGYRQSLDEVNHKILALKNTQTEKSGSIDMNNQKIGTDKERIEEARVLQEGLRKEIESASEKIKGAKALVESLKKDLEQAASDRTAKQRSVEERELILNNLLREVEEVENKVKICKVQTVDYLAKETRIKNELIKMGADIQNRKARQRRLEAESRTVSGELSEVAKVLEGILAEFKNIENNVSSIRSNLDEKKGLNNSILARIKSITENISGEETKRATVRSRIEVLEESIKRHEGFGRGAKSILAKKDEGGAFAKGILGVLADLLKVERGYEEAVSTFLGDDAQLIITESDNDIQGAISYLKENNLGKASFVSLETISRIGRQAKDRVKVSGEGIAPLENIVKIDQGYQGLVKHFFTGAYIADSLELCLKKFGSSSATFVTKSGAMFDNGRMSGGSMSDARESTLIGRKERLEDFKADLSAVEKRLGCLNNESKDMNETAKNLVSEIGSMEETLKAEEINFANIKMKKDAQEESARKLNDELALLTSEFEEAAQVIDELTLKGESLNKELNIIEKEKTDAQTFIDNSQSLIIEKRSMREQTALEINTLKTEAQSLEREEANVNNNLKSQEAMLFEFEDTLYSKEGLLKESREKVKLLEEEMVKLTSQNEGLSKELKVLEEEVAAIANTKSEANDKLSIAELQLEEKNRSLEALRNQIRDLDVKLAELNYKKTSLRERMNQSYKMDIETTHIELEDSIDWDALRSQVAELKERLEKMGSVNLVAIEEHKELEERHSFLVHQQEDLLNAKDSLHKAIQKINKTTKDLFIETFQKIQVEFKNFFRLLFGGGQAELVLIDEQDVLESGIEIIVRPPGKKLQNLMLLSGGEKALTAIALLFAIFKVRPSPFCILDEIDAPLDESNVIRFSNVLKEFLKISQFIIITHNKRTIELADVMYGITMQERGVSKIVSVKFGGAKVKGEKTSVVSVEKPVGKASQIIADEPETINAELSEPAAAVPPETA